MGGLTVSPIRARIVSASNRDLREMISLGKFREDLYYRLAVFPLFISPLRERREDIIVLSRHFLSHFIRDSSPAMHGNLSLARQCPGTIQLGQVCRDSGRQRTDPAGTPAPSHVLPAARTPAVPGSDQPTLEELGKRYIRLVLQSTGNRRNEAARKLGISTATLWRRLQQQYA